jgi:cobalt/nickel transport system permease protein
MHIPDGYLSPETCAAMYAVMAPAWWYSGRRLAAKLSSTLIPFLSLGSAFAFALMSFQLPVPNGTSVHGVGGTLVALALGPDTAVVTVSVALAVQALFFGDGGVLTYGANAFSAALCGPIVGYATFRLLRGGFGLREEVAGAAAGYAGVNVTGVVAALQLGLQPALFHGADGAPLYNPFGFREVLPAMVLAHALLAGPVEAALTGFGLRALKTQGWIQPFPDRPRRTAWTWLLLVVGLVLLAPLSALAPGAWGEWTPEELAGIVGFVPVGIAQLAPLWRAPWPDLEATMVALVGSAWTVFLGTVAGTTFVGSVCACLLLVLKKRRMFTKET